MRRQLNRRFLVWKYFLDINFVWLLVYVVASVRGDGSLNRDVCLYVGERYGWLAELYRDLGKLERSKALRQKAQFFLVQGEPGEDDPPPAGALAMPIPEPPIIVNAIGFRLGARHRAT